MNRLRLLISTALLTLCLSSALHAEHDSGQGKSQDDKETGSIATAPEPETYWMLLTGLLALALMSRRRQSATSRAN